MWLRIFLGLVLLFQSVWPQTVIEYGGISFECDADICGWPEEDYVAKEVAKACDKTARDVYFEAGFLCDTEQKWRKFEPYRDYSENGATRWLECVCA